jgi:hypothetical protein
MAGDWRLQAGLWAKGYELGAEAFPVPKNEEEKAMVGQLVSLKVLSGETSWKSLGAKLANRFQGQKWHTALTYADDGPKAKWQKVEELALVNKFLDKLPQAKMPDAWVFVEPEEEEPDPVVFAPPGPPAPLVDWDPPFPPNNADDSDLFDEVRALAVYVDDIVKDTSALFNLGEDAAKRIEYIRREISTRASDAEIKRNLLDRVDLIETRINTAFDEKEAYLSGILDRLDVITPVELRTAYGYAKDYLVYSGRTNESVKTFIDELQITQSDTSDFKKAFLTNTTAANQAIACGDLDKAEGLLKELDMYLAALVAHHPKTTTIAKAFYKKEIERAFAALPKNQAVLITGPPASRTPLLDAIEKGITLKKAQILPLRKADNPIDELKNGGVKLKPGKPIERLKPVPVGKDAVLSQIKAGVILKKAPAQAPKPEYTTLTTELAKQANAMFGPTPTDQLAPVDEFKEQFHAIVDELGHRLHSADVGLAETKLEEMKSGLGLYETKHPEEADFIASCKTQIDEAEKAIKTVADQEYEKRLKETKADVDEIAQRFTAQKDTAQFAGFYAILSNINRMITDYPSRAESDLKNERGIIHSKMKWNVTGRLQDLTDKTTFSSLEALLADLLKVEDLKAFDSLQSDIDAVKQRIADRSKPQSKPAQDGSVFLLDALSRRNAALLGVDSDSDDEEEKEEKPRAKNRTGRIDKGRINNLAGLFTGLKIGARDSLPVVHPHQDRALWWHLAYLFPGNTTPAEAAKKLPQYDESFLALCLDQREHLTKRTPEQVVVFLQSLYALAY